LKNDGPVLSVSTGVCDVAVIRAGTGLDPIAVHFVAQLVSWRGDSSDADGTAFSCILSPFPPPLPRNNISLAAVRHRSRKAAAPRRSAAGGLLRVDRRGGRKCGWLACSRHLPRPLRRPR